MGQNLHLGLHYSEYYRYLLQTGRSLRTAPQSHNLPERNARWQDVPGLLGTVGLVVFHWALT